MTQRQTWHSGQSPFARYVPLAALCLWFFLVPVLWASPLTVVFGERGGILILSVIGVCIPLLALGIGLHTFQKIRRSTGLRDGFLSWCVAANAAILLLFCFFLLLIWPILLKSP